MSNPRTLEWMLLSFHPPGETEEPAGIIVVDSSNRVIVKCKRKLTSSNDRSVQAIWSGMVRDFKDEEGGYEAVRFLEQNGSHNFRVSSRKVLVTGLYDRYIESNSRLAQP